MQTISDLLIRDLSRTIEEIIMVDQTDEASVYTELTEYVPTERLKRAYRSLLRAMAEYNQEPYQGTGVWVSGFFGSGKSSFVKNLGYALADRPVQGRQASELFGEQIEDPIISDLLQSINRRFPHQLVMFDISKSSEVRRGDEKIAEVVYRSILSALDYALDYDLAELEIELEAEGRLNEFVALCPKINNGIDWRRVRKGSKKLNQASAILHRMDPAIFPNADSWSNAQRVKQTTLTVETVVQRAFQLAERRCTGKTLLFIVDEVGQYVARSDSKIEDLRALVEEFGKENKNRVARGLSAAPIWFVVTSQEKLEEVVAAIDSKKVELARLQDRFKHRIDLAPSDIREVATKRVLAKKDDAEILLQKLFRSSEGQLNAAINLERTTRQNPVSEKDFIEFYPYLPHYIELSIDIVSGIRLQPGASKHLGGSNRTIIKQAYEMLVSERTNLASMPIGTLVTLDKTYELVEGNLSSEKQKDISDIRQRFEGDETDRGMTLRVAKVIALLEFVRDLPRTERNIAAFLVNSVGAPAPQKEVMAAIEKLSDAQFIRNTEEGWKLQTAQEKSWEAERRSHLDPKPVQRNEIAREVLTEIFNDARLKTHNYQKLRSFRIGITVNARKVGDDGQIPLALIVADDYEDLPAQLQQARTESRHNDNRSILYWVFALTKELDDLIANLYASQEMTRKYEQLKAQNRITREESACLQDESVEIRRRKGLLREKMVTAIEAGQGIFQGMTKDASALGKNIYEIFREMFNGAIPTLYPKLEMGARTLKGTEAEEILKAANLSGLSQIFYDGENGLNLVRKEAANYIPNVEADIVKEVMDYLNREYSYGNKETRYGKTIETHFGGLGYGWERDILRLILAVLFRAGSITVNCQGKQYDSYQDPNSRSALTNNTAFRSALFTPTKPIDLKTLQQAVLNYESLSGTSVDMEKNAIATAFNQFADSELVNLIPLHAQAKVNALPVTDLLSEYKSTLETVRTNSVDDRVRQLAGEGHSLQEIRKQVRKIREAMNSDGIAIVQRAKIAIQAMWPALIARGINGELTERAAELQTLLISSNFYESIPQIKNHAVAIVDTYVAIYGKLHETRALQYKEAIDWIKGQADWLTVPMEMQSTLLKPLVDRACTNLHLPLDTTICVRCNASLGQMESDLAALNSLQNQVTARIQELLAPAEEVTERVRLAQFFPGSINSEEIIEEAIEQLRAHLYKLFQQGIRIIVD